MTTNRVPEGVPTGGQFAASAKNESDVALTGPTDAALLAEALGDGPDLTADEQRLLGILLDSKVNEYVGNDTDLDLVLEDLESNGDDSSYYGAEQVAERLYAHYEMAEGPDTQAGDFSFRLNRTESGVESYTVGTYLGTDSGAWMSEIHDSKYLSVDRNLPDGTSGLRKAIAIAEVIDGDFQNVCTKARRLGLVPGDPEPTKEATSGVCGACNRPVSTKDGDTWLDENGGYCMPTGGAMYRHSDIKPTTKPDLYAAKQALAAFDKAADAETAMDAARQMDHSLAAYVAAETAPRPAVWPQNDDERAAFEDYKNLAADGNIAESFRTWYDNRITEEG